MDIVIRLVLWQYMVTHAVLNCPLSIADWNKASVTLQCREPNFYHCLRDENGIFEQQCLQRVWIQDGMCPEYNSKAKRIDVYDCNSQLKDCPTATFWSNAVYIYPGCFTYATSTTTRTTNFGEDGSVQKEDGNTTIIITVAVCAAIIIIIILCVIVWRIRRRRRNREPVHIESSLTDVEAKKTRDIKKERHQGVSLEIKRTLPSSKDKGTKNKRFIGEKDESDGLLGNEENQHSSDADILEKNGVIIFISDDKSKIDSRMRALDSSERFGKSQYTGSLSFWDPDKDISLYLFPYTFNEIKSSLDLRLLSEKFEEMYKHATQTPQDYFVLSVNTDEWRRYEKDLLEYDFFRKSFKSQI